MPPFFGKFQNLEMSPTHFCATSYRFRDLKILNLDLQKVGKGHGVQFCRHHSMSKVKICKILSYIFALALTISEI